MRRSAALLIPVVALGTTFGTALAAGAAPPERTTYTVAECFSHPIDFGMRETGPVLHIWGSNAYDLYQWDEGQWTWVGTNTTRPTGTMAPHAGTFHGTFSVESEVLGDFEGTWAWGMSDQGTAVGRSPSGDALLKLTLYEGSAGYQDVTGMEPADPDETCGVTTYRVMHK